MKKKWKFLIIELVNWKNGDIMIKELFLKENIIDLIAILFLGIALIMCIIFNMTESLNLIAGGLIGYIGKSMKEK